MPLKESYANRRSKGWGDLYELELGHKDLSALGMGKSIHFDFDLGSPVKHEKISLYVGSGDFDAVAEAMIEIDEKAALRAFARAIQRMRYLAPEDD
ncbi:hypothetical protein [Ensifer aridi]|uniref:hypothetical protein n=1 Tax=Ensifer aridi TaxID=1708715 RepID=UPI000A11EE61|nr:hypothetical protein [Ensifer aridi]